MVAVWLSGRPVGALLKAAAAVPMSASSIFSRKMNSVGGTGRVISVAAVVLGQRQECFFQSGACNLQAGKPGVASQQLSNHRLSLDGMNLNGLTVFFHFRHTRNLSQTGDSETGD